MLADYSNDADSVAAALTADEALALFDAAEDGVPSDIEDDFDRSREGVIKDLAFKRAYADAAVPGQFISEEQERLTLEFFSNLTSWGDAVSTLLVWTADCGDTSDSGNPVSVDGVPLAEALGPKNTTQSFDFFSGPVEGEPGRPFAAGTIIEGGSVVETATLRTDWSQPAIVAAACHNYIDWSEDVTLDTDVAILEDVGLYRSAELLDGEFRESSIAIGMEHQIVEGESLDSALSALRADGASEEDLEEAELYYAERGLSPAEDVRDRYVVYVVSVTTRSVMINRVAIDPEREKISPPAGDLGPLDVVVNPSERVEVPTETCWAS